MALKIRFGRYPCSLKIYQKYIVCFMVWMSCILLYGSRNSLRNVGFQQVLYHTNSSKNDTICGKDPASLKYRNTTVDIPTWEWTRKHLSTVHYFYNVGFMISQIPVGVFCDLHGGRYLLSMGLLGSGVINFILPFVLHKTAWIHISGLMFLNGVFQGSCAPAACSLLARWIPNDQLTFLVAIAYSGVPVGNALCKIVSAYFTTHLLYWPGPFFLWPCATLVWYLFFIQLVFSSPVTHPYVSQKEKQQLVENFGAAYPCRIPWRHILQDSALWAIISSYTGHKILQAALDLSIPVFAYGLLNIDVHVDPQYFFAPIFLQCAVTVPCGLLGDYWIKRDIVPTTYLRSIYVGFGSIMGSFFFLASTWMGCHQGMVISGHILGAMFTALFATGIPATIIDRTRYYAGLYGALVHSLSSIATPISLELFIRINKHNTMNEWSKVFWFTLAGSIFTNVIYLMWNEGERAKWDVIITKEQLRRIRMQK